MTHASRAMVAAIALFATTAVADAQTCMGLAPFSAGRVQIGASGDFGNDAQAFIASLKLVLNTWVSILPSVDIPVGLEDA